jgi:hypothetical protein
MLLGNVLDYFFGDSRTLPEARQMQLPYFSAAAHVVHQVERVSFAADKRHDFTSSSRQLA